MAHHSGNPLEGFNGNFMDEFKKNMSENQAKGINDELLKRQTPNLGATGNFPDGKLDESDEGEIKIGITQIDGRVVISFGKPVEWIGFTKEQAVEIAQSLIKNATY